MPAAPARRGADGEGEHVGAPHVDPEQARRLPVLGRRANRLAPAGALEEQVEQGDQGERDDEAQETPQRDHHAPEREGASAVGGR